MHPQNDPPHQFNATVAPIGGFFFVTDSLVTVTVSAHASS